MKHHKLRRELLLAIIFSLVYLALRMFHYHLDRFFQGVNISIITYICLALLLALLAQQVFKLIRRRRKSKKMRVKLKFVFYLPAIILVMAILYTFSPFKFDSEKIEGKVILSGCYEGGTSQAVIRIRDNNNFEIKWAAEATGYDEWYIGTYKQSKDTFFLTYIDKFPEKFGSVILNTGQTLISLDTPHSNSRENYFVPFYIGNCKGEPK